MVSQIRLTLSAAKVGRPRKKLPDVLILCGLSPARLTGRGLDVDTQLAAGTRPEPFLPVSLTGQGLESRAWLTASARPVVLTAKGCDVGINYRISIGSNAGWRIPDELYEVAGVWYSYTGGQTYNASQHVDSTNTTFVYSITSQLKNGVSGDYGFEIDPSTGVITVPADLPDPVTTDIYSLTVHIQSSPYIEIVANTLLSGQLSSALDIPSLNEIAASGDKPLESTTILDNPADFGSGWVTQTCSNWTAAAPYDPIRKQIAWVGGPHGSQTYPYGTRLMRYNVTRNKWTQLMNPFDGVEGGSLSANASLHGFDNNCIVGDLLLKRGWGNGEGSNIFVYDLSTDQLLGEIPQPFLSNNGDPGAGTAMKFHPGIGPYGSILLSTNGALRKMWLLVLNEPGVWPLASGWVWRGVATQDTEYDLDQTYQTICQYNAISGYALIGGGNSLSFGSTKFLLIGDAPEITAASTANLTPADFPDIRRADSPVSFGCSEGDNGANKGCVVPWQDDFIAFHKDGIYRLNTATAQWSRLQDLPAAIAAVNPAEFATHRMLASPVEEYGVIALIKHGGGDPPGPLGESAMWLYKP